MGWTRRSEGQALEPGTRIEIRDGITGVLKHTNKDGSIVIELDNEPGVDWHVRSAGHGRWAALTRLAEVEA